MRRFLVSSSSIAAIFSGVRARGSSTTTDVETLNRALQDVLDQFGEARELINDAAQSKGSVYFEEDKDDAVQQTEACLALWESLKKQGASSDAAAIVLKMEREHDMKFKQLKAELDTLLEDDDH